MQQSPVLQNKDISGEEAYLMRARLSAKPVQQPPSKYMPNIIMLNILLHIY